MFTKTYSRRATWRFMALMTMGALAVAGSLFCIGKANADDPEQDYLAYLTDHGLTVKDIRGAVGLGYSICSSLPNTNGETLVEEMTAANPMFTYAQMSTLLHAAVINLCPSQLHLDRLPHGVSA